MRIFEKGMIKASCAPGANLTKYAGALPGGPDPKWCQLCVGDQSADERNKCARNNDEHFYGYSGALESV